MASVLERVRGVMSQGVVRGIDPVEIPGTGRVTDPVVAQETGQVIDRIH